MKSKKNVPTPFRQGSSRRRRSRGSVLILVVSLLVLMALIGTAWISTTRVDRSNTVQNTHNTQIDLLAAGAARMIQAALAADLFDALQFRHGGGQYGHADGTATDAFLASRVPVLREEVTLPWNPGPPAPTYVAGTWVRVGSEFYVCRQTHMADPGKRPGSGAYWALGHSFSPNEIEPDDDSPPYTALNVPVWPAVSRVLPPDTQFEDLFGQAPPWTERVVASPAVLPAADPKYPALRFYHPLTNRIETVVAGDADGDGVADSFLYRLPVGRLNGLDYFVAIRIVDDNAAINASTALAPLVPDAAAVARFPSSVSLAGMLSGTNRQLNDQYLKMNRLRLAGSFDDTRPFSFSFTNDAPAADDGTRRTDFLYASVEQLMQWQLSRRPGNPGLWFDSNAPYWTKALASTELAALLYRGGTLYNPDLMPRSALETILAQTIYDVAANHPGAQPPGGMSMANQSAYPTNDRRWPAMWFARNHDHRQLSTTFGPENPNDPPSVRNRRALLAVRNGVSAAQKSWITPRQWDPRAGYDMGDGVPFTIGGKTLNFVCFNPQVRGAPRLPGTAAPPPATRNSHPAQVLEAWEPLFENFSTKVSVNSGTFGGLFLAFWQAMGEPVPGGTPPHHPNDGDFPQQAVQSPFKDALLFQLLNNPAFSYDDPYIGRHFFAAAPGVAAPVFTPSGPLPPGNPAQTEHPLRMFAPPIRAVPAAAGAPWGPATPRLLQDETMRLRAALAAVNAMDMRDNDDVVTVQEVTLRVAVNRGTEEEFEWQDDDDIVYARARVYGHERQPFITEVYANTQNTPPAGGTANENGYVAVEIHNPHPYPISLFNCRLATIDRRSATPGVPTGNLVVNDYVNAPTLAPAALSAAVSNLLGGAAFMPPYVVPANGYLVLENFAAVAPPGGGTALPPATYRPASTGMPPGGAMPNPVIGGTVPVRNFAYLPNLHKVIDKEMVLLRPLGAVSTPPPTVTINGDPYPCILYAATPAESGAGVDMVPLDSFDFTGLPNRDVLVTPAYPPPITKAYAWHYARPTGPTKPWRFVYPGRYDASQSLNVALLVPRPRHQGTFEAGFAGPDDLGWDTTAGAAPRNEDPWDPTLPIPPGVQVHPQPFPSFVETPTYGTPLPNATYGLDNEHTIQLSTSLDAYAGAAGPFAPAGAAPYQYPFGGFARDGDVLNVPFIGSYRIKLTHWRAWPRSRMGQRDSAVVDQVSEPSAYNTVLELNAITMDSAMAEDTDPDNYPRAGDSEITRTEQIGRFAPSLEELGLALPPIMPSGFPAIGVVTAFSPPDPNALGATLEDTGRGDDPGDANDRWNGYELEIIDGPGKGQVRQVAEYTSGGNFTLVRAWDRPLEVGRSKYILRKGPLWKFISPSAPTAYPSGDPAYYGGTAAYRWAADVLEYLTVESPQDDHFPPADPLSYGNASNSPPPPHAVGNKSQTRPASITYGRKVGGGAGAFNGTDNLLTTVDYSRGGVVQFVTGPAAGEVRPVTGYNPRSRQVQVQGGFSVTPADGDVFRIISDSEDDVPVSGLINLNTAPWRVLASLPFFPTDRDEFGYEFDAGYSTSSNGRPDNFDMAMAIAHFRDGDPSSGLGGNGPFRSAYDLYKVPVFTLEQVRVIQAAGDPDDAAGDWTPQNVTGAAVDNVRHDYEENFLLANRISNLVTTRSDHFTCYVLVQGWRGAGTTNPELVVQRRLAFTADRSGVTPTSKEVPLQYFYNE